MRPAVLAAALAVAACGVRGRPLAPELVQPEPPTALAAKPLAEGVQLTWRRPTKYSGGKHMRDLAGFEIERAAGDGWDFVRVGTVTLTDQTRFQQERTITWVDTSAVAGATYRYRVIATTLDDYRSAPSDPLLFTYQPRPAPPAR